MRIAFSTLFFKSLEVKTKQRPEKNRKNTAKKIKAAYETKNCKPSQPSKLSGFSGSGQSRLHAITPSTNSNLKVTQGDNVSERYPNNNFIQLSTKGQQSMTRKTHQKQRYVPGHYYTSIENLSFK